MEPTPPKPPGFEWKRIPTAGKVVVIGLVIGALYLAATSFGLLGVQAEAQRVCSDASEGIVLTAAIRMTNAIENSSDPAALAAAIREECPEIVNQILELGEDDSQDLIGRANMQMDECDQDGARGTVRNNHSAPIDVTIEVQFLGDDRVLVDTGIDFVNSLRPGQTAQWDASFFGAAIGFCDPVITSVRES